MLKRFDEDGDGKIDMDQLDDRVKGFAARMLERMGMEVKGTIDIDEIGKRIQEQQNGGQAGRTPRASRNKPKKKEVPASERTEGASQYGGSYSYRQPMEKFQDLPDWFEDRDANEDDQVSLAEYFTSRSTRQREIEIKKFGKLDLDDDGIVTPAEAASVEDN